MLDSVFGLFFFCSVLSICLICHSSENRIKSKESHTYLSLFSYDAKSCTTLFKYRIKWRQTRAKIYVHSTYFTLSLSLSITKDSVAIKTIRISHENSFKSVAHSKHNMHVIFFQGVFYALSIQSNALCHFCYNMFYVYMCKFMSILHSFVVVLTYQWINRMHFIIVPNSMHR